MKLKKNSRVRVAGLSSFFALLAIFGLAIFCPTSGDSADAASRSQRLKIDFVLRQSLAQQNLSIDFFLNSGGVIDWQRAAQVLGIDFVIQKQISLGMDTPGNIAITETQPTTSGVFKSGATSFTVGTNSANGLSVYVYSKSGTTNLVGTASTANTIATLSSAVTGTGTSFTKDRWGYNLQANASTSAPATTSMSFKGLAGSKGSADYTGAANGSQKLWLTFGTKVSTSTVPDTYKQTVSINTVATPEQTTKVAALMAEFDALIAESQKMNAAAEGEVQLDESGTENVDDAEISAVSENGTEDSIE